MWVLITLLNVVSRNVKQMKMKIILRVLCITHIPNFVHMQDNASKLLLAIMESRHDSENADRILFNIQFKQLVCIEEWLTSAPSAPHPIDWIPISTISPRTSTPIPIPSPLRIVLFTWFHLFWNKKNTHRLKTTATKPNMPVLARVSASTYNICPTNERFR